MNDGLDWLTANLSSAPVELREVMSAAIIDAAKGDPSKGAAESLALGARALYEEVLAGSGERKDALVLLAADALLTHALQLQAETNPDELAAFAERWGGRGELGAIVERARGDR